MTQKDSAVSAPVVSVGLPDGLPSPEGEKKAVFYRLAWNTAWVAGIFTVVTAGVLLGHLGWRMTQDPFDTAEFQVGKARLAQRPEDPAIQEQLRTLDRELRRRYFYHRRFAAVGAILLLCGGVLTVASARWASSLRPQLPQPGPYLGPSDQDMVEREWARMGLALATGIFLGAALMAGLAFPTLLPRPEDLIAQLGPHQAEPPDVPLPAGPGENSGAFSSSEKQKPASASSPPREPQGKPSELPRPPLPETSRLDSEAKPSVGVPAPGGKNIPGADQTSSRGLSGEILPAVVPEGPDPQADRTPEAASLEEWEQYWPRFRGPEGNGISRHSGSPTHWNTLTGEGLVWKTPLPLPGHNSPIVWKDWVFVSGADAQRREVYCLDAMTGKMVWRRGLPKTSEGSGKVPKVSRETGFAAPTMTTDGRRVFAIFANGDVAAFDMQGRLVWIRGLGIPENHYGHAASLETWQNLLFVQFDQGMIQQKKSQILALDTITGKTVWERQREVAVSWATPLLIRREKQPQLITAADPWVIAYRPDDGQELWRVRCLSGEHGVSPAYGNGLVHVGSEYSQWFAIRVDGQGDVTQSHILWNGEEGLPDVCSPLVTEKYLFLLMTYGTLTCYEAHTGKVLWTKDFDQAQFIASPSWAGGRVYVLGQIETDQKDPEGNPLVHTKVWVLEPTDTEAKEVGVGLLDESCVASPAFQPDRIYIRGKHHLFCIGTKNQAKK